MEKITEKIFFLWAIRQLQWNMSQTVLLQLIQGLLWVLTCSKNKQLQDQAADNHLV